MDRKAIIVLVISFLLLILWYPLVNRLYPPKAVPRNTNVVAAITNRPGSLTNQPSLSAATNVAIVAPTIPKAITSNLPEETIVVSNKLARYTITSHGGGLKLVEFFNYKQRAGCRDKTGSNSLASLNSDAPLPIFALPANEALQGDGVFKLTQTQGGVRAEKALPNGLFLVKEFTPTNDYLVDATVRIQNRSPQRMALPAQEWNIGSA